MRNKLVRFLVSLLVALGLWLYVISVVSPNSKADYHNIPVVFDGEAALTERNLMVTKVSADTVSLELSGNRSDLAKVNSSNITIRADLSKIYDEGAHALNYSIAYPGDIASNAFVVESKNPSVVTVTVEKKQTKDVPVEVSWVGSTPDDFMSDRENRVLDPAYVTVTGPASVVSLIEKAVVAVDLTDQRESVSDNFTYTLCDVNNTPVDAELITTNIEQIRVDVKIQRMKEIALKVSVSAGGGATESDAVIELSSSTIRVAGSDAALEALGDSLTLGTVKLADVDKESSLTFPINLPEGITNLSGVNEVTAKVTLQGLSVREFLVEGIQVTNVPEGLEAELITEKLTVTVRGPSADVRKMTVDDIRVSVDFTGAEVGTSTFKVSVEYLNGYERVGTFKADTVSATLKPAEER